MTEILRCVSPIDGSVVVERPLATEAEITAALDRAKAAQRGWPALPVEERGAILTRAVDAFVARKAEIAEEVTRQMGRPVSQSPFEVGGFEERARHMIEAAPAALADVDVGPKAGFRRFIRPTPLGTVLVIAPWNYPYLTAVNAVIPALMAGNAVILKHSHQTPLCAERFRQAFDAAQLPEGVFQHLHLSHDAAERMIAVGSVGFVSFTGSVRGGGEIERAAAHRHIGTSLELGGKDPAYVRADANLDHAIENLVDGVCFNSGQSCCGIERIYVDALVHDRFVEGFVDLARQYRLGDPLDPETNLGPMVRATGADFCRAQVADAVRAGAKALIDPKSFAADAPGSAYMAPQVCTGVDHRMRIMREESFGPIVGIMPVRSDEEAVQLMNDSDYGLTAAIWTRDPEAAIRIGDAVETGTWFMNRCDYLDPALAWVGVKDSGRGVSLSRLQYTYLTRPKSFHLRTET